MIGWTDASDKPAFLFEKFPVMGQQGLILSHLL